MVGQACAHGGAGLRARRVLRRWRAGAHPAAWRPTSGFLGRAIACAMRCSWLVLTLLPVSLHCSSAEVEGVEDDTPLAGLLLGDDNKADGTGLAAWAITASSVEALKGSLASVRPAVRTADPGHTPEYYLDPATCLGPLGPIG